MDSMLGEIYFTRGDGTNCTKYWSWLEYYGMEMAFLARCGEISVNGWISQCTCVACVCVTCVDDDAVQVPDLFLVGIQIISLYILGTW
jgi:hypothetical protein